ncbi:MAG: GxxExxY protein [Fidelibacterota bacterium]
MCYGSSEVQRSFPIIYKGNHLKDFVCDLVVNREVIVGLKAVKQMGDFERAQVLNYLRATRLRLGLLINFASKSLVYERIVL